jgi:hypothetical protein
MRTVALRSALDARRFEDAVAALNEKLRVKREHPLDSRYV